MIRCKETYKSVGRDDAITGLQKLVREQYAGWTKSGDIFVTRQRGMTPGSNGYTAYVWMSRAE